MTGSATDARRRMSRRPSSASGANIKATRPVAKPINIPNPARAKRMESNTNTKRSTVDVELENNGTCCAAAHKVPNTKSISQKITTPTALDAKAVITQLTIHLLAARSRFSKALPNRVAIDRCLASL